MHKPYHSLTDLSVDMIFPLFVWNLRFKVLECPPKWSLLKEIIDEIKSDFNEQKEKEKREIEGSEKLSEKESEKVKRKKFDSKNGGESSQDSEGKRKVARVEVVATEKDEKRGEGKRSEGGGEGEGDGEVGGEGKRDVGNQESSQETNKIRLTESSNNMNELSIEKTLTSVHDNITLNNVNSLLITDNTDAKQNENIIMTDHPISSRENEIPINSNNLNEKKRKQNEIMSDVEVDTNEDMEIEQEKTKEKRKKREEQHTAAKNALDCLFALRKMVRGRTVVVVKDERTASQLRDYIVHGEVGRACVCVCERERVRERNQLASTVSAYLCLDVLLRGQICSGGGC